MSQLGMAKGSVTEIKPNVYRIRVDAGPDPTTGKRRQVSKVVHGGKRDANTALHRLLNEVESGLATSARQTIGELMDEWLSLKRGSLSPKTISIYEECTARFIRPTLGKRQLTKLSPRDIDQFYGALAKGGLSPYRIRQVHGTLRAALSQATKWQMTSVNVAMSATPPQLPKRTDRSISPEEVSQVIERTIKDYGPSLGRFITLAALTGARRGELLGLRNSNVDERQALLVIERSVISVKGQPVVKSTKTGQSRTISLDQLSMETLVAQREEIESLAREGGFIQDPNPYFFAADPTGTKSIHPDWPSHVFRKVCDSLSLPYHLHELRHFSATQLIAAGVDVRTVSGRLGHSDPSITMRIYAHVLGAKDREAANILGGIINTANKHHETQA